MASNQMIGDDMERPLKRPRLDTDHTVDTPLTPPPDGQCPDATSGVLATDSMVSSSSDADLMSGSDSGFQEFMARVSPKETDEANDCSNDSQKYPLIVGPVVQSAHKDIDDLLDEFVGTDVPDGVQLADAIKGPDFDCDDAASDVSDLSCISCLSDMSGQQWKPISGPVAWVHKQMCSGTDPRTILTEMVADNTLIPNNLDNLTLWKIIVNMLSEPPPRRKLKDVNTLDDCLQLINRCNRILVLTGAGVSVSCGIPDFRSRDGIYARLSKDFPDLPDPQAMFDIHYFRKDPRPFFKFAKEIYPGQFEPSISHRFIRTLEQKNKLLRSYTQNIDTLERTAGIERVITCHGSFATATCTQCKLKVDASFIKKDIFEQKIPKCPQCPKDSDNQAVIKPDIVFFGEGLSDEFHSAMSYDKDECDLLIVMGSSLKVRPVALIPSSIPESVPQILINREPLNHLTFDIELLGDCDIIVKQLCDRLGTEWSDICQSFGSQDKEIESKNLDDFNVEVNNNNTQHNSSLPFAFNTTVNELSHHNSCHQNDNKRKADNLEPDPSHSTDAPKPSEDQLVNQLADDKYLYISPSRYIFKGAEVFETDLSTGNKMDGEGSEDDSSSNSSSSLSTPCSSSSSSSSPSSSSLSTSDSHLSPVNTNSNNFTDNSSETTKLCYSYSKTLSSSSFSIPTEPEISKT